MRQEMLAQLHESHQGLVRTKQRAQLTIYWPGIDNDIDNIILACKKCQDCLPSNTKEPNISKPKPNRPFQEIAGDFCSYATQDYLVLVDCYCDWPNIILMGHDPQLPTSSRWSDSHSAVQVFLTYSGLMKAHISHQRSSVNLP